MTLKATKAALNSPSNSVVMTVQGTPRRQWTDEERAWTLELDHHDFVDGARLSVDEALCTLKLGRISYRYKRRQGWFGNWCWDAFYMPRPAALHLLRGVLAGGQWRVSCGPDRVVGWVERAGRCYLSTRQLPNSQRSTITSPPVQVTV